MDHRDDSFWHSSYRITTFRFPSLFSGKCSGVSSWVCQILWHVHICSKYVTNWMKGSIGWWVPVFMDKEQGSGGILPDLALCSVFYIRDLCWHILRNRIQSLALSEAGVVMPMLVSFVKFVACWQRVVISSVSQFSLPTSLFISQNIGSLKSLQHSSSVLNAVHPVPWQMPSFAQSLWSYLLT